MTWGSWSTKEPFQKLMNQGLILAEDGQKMSKSLGNVVNPDEIVEQYGADTLLHVRNVYGTISNKIKRGIPMP